MPSERINREMRKYVRQALIEARKAILEVENLPQEASFETLRREISASAHANQALSFALAAEEIYISGSSQPCECYEFECVIEQIKVFVRELTTNVERHRSHEWSKIEHDRLCETVEGTEFDFEL